MKGIHFFILGVLMIAVGLIIIHEHSTVAIGLCAVGGGFAGGGVASD